MCGMGNSSTMSELRWDVVLRIDFLEKNNSFGELANVEIDDAFYMVLRVGMN